MRRCGVVATAVLGILGCLAPATAATSAQLTDVRYSALAGYSRVTLLFDGEVRYSRLTTDGVVRLGFSHTAVAIPLKARRQLLSTGLVTAISVVPLPGDSLVVSLMLRAGSTYRCLLPASGNALFVDVLPTGGQTALPRATSVPARGNVPPASLLPKRVVSGPRAAVKAPATGDPEPGESRASLSAMVDIPGIAREQVHAESGTAVVRMETGQPVQRTLSPLAMLGLSLLVVFLLTGTGAVLTMAFRKKPPAPAARPATGRPAFAFEPPAYAGRDARDADLLVDEPDVDDESQFQHETSLQLARTFRRGSEEITLAHRMHDRTTPQLSGARMEETLTHSKTPHQRLTFARKLGVGRGEMDLAMKLRAIRPVEKKEAVGS